MSNEQKKVQVQDANEQQSKFTHVRSPTGLPPTLSKRSADSISRRDVQQTRKDTDAVPRHHLTTLSNTTEKLWKLMSNYLPADVDTIQKQLVNHVEYTLARTRYNFDNYAAYQATALSVRDRLIESWNDTQQYFTEQGVKRVYYLSMEFLMGRSLQNSLFNLELENSYVKALRDVGYMLEDLYDEEKDAALGNGGLGRLAACFMDSLATMNYPAWGYGIRYTYGMFQQQILDGYQAEFPDYWLTFGNPWEIERLDVFYPIHFYGRISEYTDHAGRIRYRWEAGETVFAVAYDTPIPGYNTYNTINIRLWSSKPSKEFDLASFNQGDYYKAIEDKQRSENITSVLYPNDNTYNGKLLRLQQQYFFSSATLCDILRRFKKTEEDMSNIPDKVAIQLNDTHPSISIAEMMRLLVDEEGLDWDTAWDITTRTFAYTNHTVLPEALEKWSVELMERLLPRHMKIIYDINYRFMKEVEAAFPGDTDRLRRMSVIEESNPKMIRMANLSIVGSHSVNGVAHIHSEILKETLFKDFYELWPDKFNNKTNGVTPRRWIATCNRPLKTIFDKWLDLPNGEWLTNMDQLANLAAHADNPQLQQEWKEAKLANKKRLADWVMQKLGIAINVNALFDVQIKRIHEYKRQLLNILGVISRYDRIRKMTKKDRKQVVPRVVFFAGKAAPGYHMAKRIIKLINSVADVVNKDPETNELLKVVYVPNYNVSVAEVMIPASELSQHISTAGTEASGTSNMKFAMNGCLILGTLDGANVEIKDCIGDDNIFIFGATADQVDRAREVIRTPEFSVDARLQRVFDLIRGGAFGPAEIFQPILQSLEPHGDHYLLTYDFPLYMEAQEKVDKKYLQTTKWNKSSILSAANVAYFSSDRTILEYAQNIWGVEPCARPAHDFNQDAKNNNSTTSNGPSKK